MDRAKFFSALRARGSGVFGTRLSTGQVSGTEAVLNEAQKRGTPLRHLAYILSTAYHETAHTMQPIAEYGKGKGRPYGKPGKHGQAQYGRGYVQLTWDANYERADRELGLSGALLKDFNLAMRPDIAAAIMFKGMAEGWFTGKKLSDYLNDQKADYVGARRIINGVDRAKMLAGYAVAFEKALRASGYLAQAPKPRPVPQAAPPARVEPVPRPETAAKPVNRVPEPSQPAKRGNPLAMLFAVIVAAIFAAWGWFISIPCNLIGIWC